jgi:hypothetical protein
VESKDTQIEKLKKQLKSLSQKHEKTKRTCITTHCDLHITRFWPDDIRERDAERTPPESEEEDEDDTVQMSSFSASVCYILRVTEHCLTYLDCIQGHRRAYRPEDGSQKAAQVGGGTDRHANGSQ